MRLPYAICELDDELMERWRADFELPTDRNRRLEEGLWRRTQDRRNAEESGWRCEHDRRRRLIHYRYSYDAVDDDGKRTLCMASLYLMYCVTYPSEEIAVVASNIDQSLAAGGWRPTPGEAWRLGDLEVTRTIHDRHPMDAASGRLFPDDYRSLELTVRSRGDVTSAADRQMPWDVLLRGMRIKDQREDPTLVSDLRVLTSYLPFHLEVGCGLSMEAGVPPLHFLHDVYQVSDRVRKKFVLDAARDDIVLRLLTSPLSVMPALTRMYRSCFLTIPTQTHWNLKALAEAGFLVGPVMTNNFDGLLGRVGLDELYLRRYDQDVPPVAFDPRAKALVVIGSHADRRRVQHRARANGMKIFFIDPEGYWEGGAFMHYPLEGIRSNDFLCRQPAAAAVGWLASHLGVTAR